jgi:predicted permease
LLPTLLFALLAVNALHELRTEPVLSIMFCALFLVFALLFARQVWRERHPLR